MSFSEHYYTQRLKELDVEIAAAWSAYSNVINTLQQYRRNVLQVVEKERNKMFRRANRIGSDEACADYDEADANYRYAQAKAVELQEQLRLLSIKYDQAKAAKARLEAERTLNQDNPGIEVDV